MGGIKDEAYEKEMWDKYHLMKDELEWERQGLSKKIFDDQKNLDNDKQRLEEELQARKDAINLKLLDDQNSEERRLELEEQLWLQKEEAERLRKMQEEQERRFWEEKDRALQAMEEAFKKM